MRSNETYDGGLLHHQMKNLPICQGDLRILLKEGDEE
jgi:hypothetical protein